MLASLEKYLYIYVVARDFGFAPNPYHGYCTLATCVPRIRASAQIGDWVMGVGGNRLEATGKVIYLMNVSETCTFNEYWADERFVRKRPVRNGSLLMMVGDNIYHRMPSKKWNQLDSHHSNPDGSKNSDNLKRDTSADKVLISERFYYFGKNAKKINLERIGYKNHRGHSKKKLDDKKISDFIKKFENKNKLYMNIVTGDPFDFRAAAKRVNQITGKIF